MESAKNQTSRRLTFRGLGAGEITRAGCLFAHGHWPAAMTACPRLRVRERAACIVSSDWTGNGSNQETHSSNPQGRFRRPSPAL